MFFKLRDPDSREKGPILIRLNVSTEKNKLYLSLNKTIMIGLKQYFSWKISILC